MSKRQPPEKYKFKPGQSGNPNGRPKLPADLLEARNFNRIEVERILNKYLRMTKAEILAAAQDSNTQGLELIVASIISNAVKHGDHQRFNFLLERIIGKVTENVHVSGSLNISHLTPDQLKKIAKAYIDE